MTADPATVSPVVDLDALRLDGGTQPRAAIDQDTVDSYAADMRVGHRFPPVQVYLDRDGVYWLADGFHRVHAARFDQAAA